jgi:hypothetical protein
VNWRAISILELVQRAEGDRAGYLRRDTFMLGRKAIYRERWVVYGERSRKVQRGIFV